jgi:hypothetical protein
MDPTTALQSLRAALASAQTHMDNDIDDPRFCVVPNGVVIDAIGAMEALDGWLMGGGFLPADWAEVNR